MEIAQRKCIRTIYGASFYAHTNPIFADLNILKFKDSYNLNLGTYFYKNQVLFDELTPNHQYNTRSVNDSNPQYQRLTLTQRQSVKFQAPSIWNQIPESIRNANNVKLFRNFFRNHMLSTYQ